MEKNIRLLILLFSLVLVIIPTVVFPNRLGTPLASGSALNMLYEIIFYGLVLFIFRRDSTLAALLVGAALTLVYRMVLGAVFGLTIIVMYSLDSSVAFSLGMTKFLPAILLQVVAAPFVMRPVYLNLADRLVGGRAPVSRPMPMREPSSPVADELRFESSSRSRSEEPTGFSTPAFGRTESLPPVAGLSGDDNQFDRAVAYLGESTAVKLALIVDAEGLTLARFNRSREDVDLWAPMAVVLENSHRGWLKGVNWREDPERIDVGTRNMRIILRRVEHVTLMILADQNVDETIHIRIAQAVDMVRKYMSERYSPAIFARVEGRYVSNT